MIIDDFFIVAGVFQMLRNEYKPVLLNKGCLIKRMQLQWLFISKLRNGTTICMLLW